MHDLDTITWSIIKNLNNKEYNAEYTNTDDTQVCPVATLAENDFGFYEPKQSLIITEI